MSRRKALTTEPSTPAADSSRRRAFFWLAIPVLWVAILLLLEGGLRLAGFGVDARLFERIDPGLLVDNSAYTARFYPIGDAWEPVQKTNLFSAEKRVGRLRLFVVGESTAQGYPFQRNHSFTAMAQSGLRAVGIDAEIINVGNSAMSSYYVREVLDDVRRHEPDMVVVYAGHNEYYGTPSTLAGGGHPLRLVLLRLREFRLVQLLERVIGVVSTGSDENLESTLMERRFAEAMFPRDSVRDGAVAEQFVRNLDAGLRNLLDDGVPALIFEPVSNLVSMPPFRSPSDSTGSATSRVGTSPSPLDAYRQRRQDLEAGQWNRAAWEEVKDLDYAPFRARSTLVRELERYARSTANVTYIPTSAELERRMGPAAFSDSLFIDHLHFNFNGQRLLAGMLAEAVVRTLYFGDERLLSGLEQYFADAERVRAEIHLTDFWEFEAYTRIAGMQSREPFESMPLPKASARVPERVQDNSLFQERQFLDSLQGASADDLFYLALDHYRLRDRDEWIRNLNAYVHLFPGHYESQLAYGVALLEDDPGAHLDAAGSYVRRAYTLSGGSSEVLETVQEVLVRVGMGGEWERFRARYLEESL